MPGRRLLSGNPIGTSGTSVNGRWLCAQPIPHYLTALIYHDAALVGGCCLSRICAPARRRAVAGAPEPETAWYPVGICIQERDAPFRIGAEPLKRWRALLDSNQ